MIHLAVTQPTAARLMARSELLKALGSRLQNVVSLPGLTEGVVLLREFRVAATSEGRVIVLWSPEYLSGTGQESWGLVQLDEERGLFAYPHLIEETFERSLYVVNQRAQGLLIDERYMHRTLRDGVHRCLAGRGEEARQLALGYMEPDVDVDRQVRKAIIVAGPERNESRLVNAVKASVAPAPAVIRAADALVGSADLRRPALETGLFVNVQVGSEAVATGAAISVPPLEAPVVARQAYSTLSLTYEDWVKPDSSLTPEQRDILANNILDRQPLRITGAAGSGKTLLMMLLAIRQLRVAEQQQGRCRVLYLAHNSAMSNKVWNRMLGLGAARYLENAGEQVLHVHTLSEYARAQLGVDVGSVIDLDAQTSKQYQFEFVKDATQQALKRFSAMPEMAEPLKESALLTAIAKSDELLNVFAALVATEIGVAIKGQGLDRDLNRYVESERSLSRLHGALSWFERFFVFGVFQIYHGLVFDENRLLDSDDMAISLLARLRTPLWQLKRRQEGYDFVFIDETQLFNENERRLFPLLTKGDRLHVPIALALDLAQQLSGGPQAGLGLLGIETIAEVEFRRVHRCTKAILQLAFHVIQRTTDLFSEDFPDFTGTTTTVVPDDHPLAASPALMTPGSPEQGVGAFTVSLVAKLRRSGLKQIAIVSHSDRFLPGLRQAFRGSRVQVQELKQRGEQVETNHPVVVLARVDDIGGQEFDAVICVGLEQGIVPPPVQGNDALAAALEQRALREMYLAFTRARYQLFVVNSYGSGPSDLLADAINERLLAT